MQHVKDNVPGEYEAFTTILEIIKNGINKREEINDALSSSIDPSYGWGKDVINTQRAGVMSRLYELGLIGKVKKGIYVKYNITEKGNEFFSGI